MEAEISRRIARDAGIETSYIGYSGKIRHIPHEALLAILQLPGLLGRDKLPRVPILIEPIVVAWNGKPPRIRPRFPKECDNLKVKVRIEFEDGERRSIPKGKLPFGYHHIELKTSQGTVRSLIISALQRSYPAKPRRP